MSQRVASSSDLWKVSKTGVWPNSTSLPSALERTINSDSLFGLNTSSFQHMLSTGSEPVSYTHLRAHETGRNLVCRLLLEKKKKHYLIQI